VLLPASPALPPLAFLDLLAGRLVDVVEGLAGDFRAEEAPVGRVDRALVVVAVAGGPLVPRLLVAVPTSLLTWRVRSSIRLVNRSTSAWLAVRLSRLWTCWRLAWIAFWPWERLRSSCLVRSEGSLF
jgi:hypothetical protein